MLNNKKIVVVLPAYNAAKTLERTYKEIPFDIVDDVVLVDDVSKDNTIEVAKQLGIKHIIQHDKNKGYGGNQKSCYNKALELDADIVVMLHPDYQYTPLLIPAMCSIIANELYQVVLGSRILGKGALRGGMPYYKYVFNRMLTFTENVLIGQKYMNNNDDFVFDNEMLSQVFMKNYEIAEITCPTKYFEDASSINFRRSATYGMGVLRVSFTHLFHKLGIKKSPLY